MDEKLTLVIDKPLTWVESSKNFLQEQTPLVVLQALKGMM